MDLLARMTYRFDPLTRTISGPGVTAPWTESAFAALAMCDLLESAYRAGVASPRRKPPALEEPRSAARERNKLARRLATARAVLGVLSRGPATFATIHATTRGRHGRVLSVVWDLEKEGAIRACFRGARRAGYEITEVGREALAGGGN